MSVDRIIDILNKERKEQLNRDLNNFIYLCYFIRWLPLFDVMEMEHLTKLREKDVPITKFERVRKMYSNKKIKKALRFRHMIDNFNLKVNKLEANFFSKEKKLQCTAKDTLYGTPIIFTYKLYPLHSGATETIAISPFGMVMNQTEIRTYYDQIIAHKMKKKIPRGWKGILTHYGRFTKEFKEYNSIKKKEETIRYSIEWNGRNRITVHRDGYMTDEFTPLPNNKLQSMTEYYYPYMINQMKKIELNHQEVKE